MLLGCLYSIALPQDGLARLSSSRPCGLNIDTTASSCSSSHCGDNSWMHLSTCRLVMPLGRDSLGDNTGPSSQMSWRMLAIFQEERAKDIACVFSPGCAPGAGCRTHSPAGDSLSRMASGNTGTALSVCATALALRTSQAEEAQAK